MRLRKLFTSHQSNITQQKSNCFYSCIDIMNTNQSCMNKRFEIELSYFECNSFSIKRIIMNWLLWHENILNIQLFFINNIGYRLTISWFLEKEKICRGHTELNHGPLDLQSNALPLSYTPTDVNYVMFLRIYFSTSAMKHLHVLRCDISKLF